jgi:hypothetical protein
VPEARYSYYRRCQVFRRNGEQCKAPAEKGEAICHAHAAQQATAFRRDLERRIVLAEAVAEMRRRGKPECEMGDLFTDFKGIQVTLATVSPGADSWQDRLQNSRKDAGASADSVKAAMDLPQRPQRNTERKSLNHKGHEGARRLATDLRTTAQIKSSARVARVASVANATNSYAIHDRTHNLWRRAASRV